MSKIVIKNPFNEDKLPFIVCSHGEAVNWRRREKKALKRLKKTGSPLPLPINFYNGTQIRM